MSVRIQLSRFRCVWSEGSWDLNTRWLMPCEKKLLSYVRWGRVLLDGFPKAAMILILTRHGQFATRAIGSGFTKFTMSTFTYCLSESIECFVAKMRVCIASHLLALRFLCRWIKPFIWPKLWVQLHLCVTWVIGFIILFRFDSFLSAIMMTTHQPRSLPEHLS